MDVIVPDCDHSVVRIPGEDACFHLYHSGIVDISCRQGVAIAQSETALMELSLLLRRTPRALEGGSSERQHLLGVGHEEF